MNGITGCSNNDSPGSSRDDGKIDVAVTTTFLNDMMKVIEGDADAFDIELIIPSGEEYTHYTRIKYELPI